MVITNTGSSTLPAGTKIMVHFNIAPGVIPGRSQETVSLSSALAPGVDASFKADISVYYEGCSARLAS